MSYSSFPCLGQTWNVKEIPMDEDISDGLIEDLNRDGLKDLLLVSGNYICIFFQRENGFLLKPDERIYYSLLGEYIDVGEVDPISPGLELLGLSGKGIKYFRNNGTHYVERPGYLISAKVDMPEFNPGPVVCDFAFDINSDGRDEIFLLQENKVIIYHFDDSGQPVSVAVEGTEKSTIASLERRVQTGFGFPADSERNPFFLFRPSVLEEHTVLFQDFNNDDRLDLISSTLRLQESRFHFCSADSPLLGKEGFTGQDSCRFYLDIDGDNNLDLVSIETKGILTENINIFPLARIYIYLKKDGGFAQTPDFFQKTIFVNDQPPFVDVDSDGDLDFISVLSEITPGSKDDIIQILLESTWSFSFRCHLFERDKGYSLEPNIRLKTKIKQNISQIGKDIPFDMSGDYDGNGSRDLMIKKDPESLYLYFFDLEAKKYIIAMKRLGIPAGFKGYQVIDLDGNGRSDLLFFTDKGVRMLFF